MSANKKIQFQIHEVNETGYEYNEQLAPIVDEQFQIRIGLRFEAKDNYFTMEAKVLCLNNKDVFLTYSAENSGATILELNSNSSIIYTYFERFLRPPLISSSTERVWSNFETAAVASL